MLVCRASRFVESATSTAMVVPRCVLGFRCDSRQRRRTGLPLLAAAGLRFPVTICVRGGNADLAVDVRVEGFIATKCSVVWHRYCYLVPRSPTERLNQHEHTQETRSNPCTSDVRRTERGRYFHRRGTQGDRWYTSGLYRSHHGECYFAGPGAAARQVMMR